MHVVTVGNRAPDPSAGGYEVVWDGLVRALRARGHEVTLLHPPALPTAWREGDWARREPLSFRMRSHRSLARAVHGVDLVVWMNLGGLAMSLLDRARGLPQLGVVHDGWMLYGPRYDPWPWAKLAPHTGLWVFNSEYTRERTVAKVPLLRTEVAPGVPAVEPAPPQPWAWRLAMIGRVAPEKGIEVAAAAARMLGVDLTLAGPVEMGVPDGATAVGPVPRERIAEAYAASDVVLFPVTWPEPFGLVPLEAMGYGRPVIATGTGGSGEYLRDGENCLLVRVGDATALAEAVRRLARDGHLRERLVRGGRATAARYTEEAFLTRMVELAEAEQAARAR